MNTNLINFLVGYFIIINIIGITIIYLKTKTDIIKIPDRILNLIHIIISMLGGFIGTLVGAEMMEYKRDSKVFRWIIPLLIFAEVCIAIYIIYNQNI